MNPRRHIERLEQQIPILSSGEFDPDAILAFQGAGFGKRSDAQMEMIRRLRLVIADPRANDQQKEVCGKSIAAIEPALKSQLESERRSEKCSQ